MNVLWTYIPHKAFHAVAVRPFQAALPALRHRVKNSELASDPLYITPFSRRKPDLIIICVRNLKFNYNLCTQFKRELTIL